jgi:hypothetical protein
MRSDTYGPYPLPSKNTCGFPRSAGSRWSRPADLPGTYYPDPTKKAQRVGERTFRKNNNANTRHEAQVSTMPFYFSSSVGLTWIHDPYQVTSVLGTRTEMFPPKTKPSTRRIFIPDQHDRVFIVTGGTSGCGFEVAKALYNLKGRFYVGRMRKPQLQKSRMHRPQRSSGQRWQRRALLHTT